MVNLILCYPPNRKYEGYGQDKRWFPVGIAGLAAYVSKHADFEINIICFDLFDCSQEEAKTKILNKIVPDSINIVGFTMMTEQRFSVLNLCKSLKLANTNIKTIVGGAHASIMYEQLLKEYPSILDHIVVGEGERALLDICREYYKYKINSQRIYVSDVREIKDINELPHAFNGIKFFEDLEIDQNTEIPIIFSRGCTDRCHFCSTYNIFPTYKTRSAYNIFSEMLKFSNKYGSTNFKFMDDSATGSINEFITLAHLIKQYNATRNFTYELTARADHFNMKLIKLLSESGCRQVSVGIESGCEKQRKSMNKKLDLALAYQNIEALKAYNIKVNLLFFVGWPGESNETIEKTCELIREFEADSNSKQPLMIFPGTAIYEKLKKEKWIDDNYWLVDQPQPYYTKEHTLDQLYSWCNQLSLAHNKYKILIAAVVNQDEETFKLYLESLNNLELQNNITIQKFFILHNSSNLGQYLDESEFICVENDLKYNSKAHNWDIEKFTFIAAAKNELIEIAKKMKSTHIFWVDSDLILHSQTLVKLLSVNVPVISEIFWTKWPGAEKELPNCWDLDHYTFYNDPAKYKREGIHRVGGTGACILINTQVYNGLINYSAISNITFSSWEDRAFCIKCAVFNIPIYIDTCYPARHLYEEKDLENYKKIRAIKKI